MHIPGADPEYVWIGDRWGSAADGLHGHDMTYWQPLHFDAEGNITQFEWVDAVNLTLPAAAVARHR